MNEQEKFWHGSFGNSYISRNKSKYLQKNNDYFFKKIFKKKYKINTIIELGSNIGNNLVSIDEHYQYIVKEMKKAVKAIKTDTKYVQE